MTATTQRRRALMPESAAIRTRDLAGLLPAGHWLAMQEETGLLALLALDQEGQPVLLAVQLFTPAEWSLLAALLEQSPAYCPYGVLLAHFSYATVNDERVARLRQQLYAAQDEGTWDLVMRPVRNVLSRVRFKLRPFGIGIVSLLELGYTLLPLCKGNEAGDTA